MHCAGSLYPDETAAYVFQQLKTGDSFAALFRALPPSLRDPQYIAAIVAKFLAAGVLLFESDSLIKRRRLVDAGRSVRGVYSVFGGAGAAAERCPVETGRFSCRDSFGRSRKLI